MIILEVKDVSICYPMSSIINMGLKDYVMQKIHGTYHVESFWANRHISFTLEEGDFLGIIGSNGAGKSTLLKAISGIYLPQEGEIKVKGRVTSLLELVSGFDPDLTVKENTFLRGSFLGYTRKYMKEKYDEIIQFAELENFQHYSFNQLSSGMKSRLAFAIASMLNPDILILDEVLSVGDIFFRQKSEKRMKEIISRGATTLFVSHSLEQVQSMATKILWLDHGEQIAFGTNVDEICSKYKEYSEQLAIVAPDPLFVAANRECRRVDGKKCRA